MPYQSFDEERGSSDSQGKLAALRLDKLRRPGSKLDLEGFHVLDVGCNEGFFCIEALKRGAISVTGIDKTAQSVKKARKRCPEGEFIEGGWWQLPKRKFDVIFFLSALHYEPREKEFFDYLADHLTDNGTLILECGVIRYGNQQKAWRQVQRGDGPKRYALLGFLMDHLLNRFAVRSIGSSVMQKGDPVYRHVFHCNLRKPIAILLQSNAMRRRADVVHACASKAVPVYYADELVMRLVEGRGDYAFPVFESLRSQNIPVRPVAPASAFIVENGLSNELAKIIAAECPCDTDLFMIDGDILGMPPVWQALQMELESRGIKCWQIDEVQ